MSLSYNRNMDIPSQMLEAKTVAIVGLSDNQERPSYQVGEYLMNHGYTIIPVNPNIEMVFGNVSYPSVSAIPKSIHIDIVDIFRKPQDVVAVLEDIVKSERSPFVWMQEGVGSLEAKAYAESHGLPVVMDVCMMKEHKRIAPKT